MEKCELETIADSMEAIDNYDDKLAFIDSILSSCGKCDTVTTPAPAKRKGGGKMSSWICYNKVCAEETGKKYMECVSDKIRAKTEYYGMKDYWKDQSNKGCPMTIQKKEGY